MESKYCDKVAHCLSDLIGLDYNKELKCPLRKD